MSPIYIIHDCGVRGSAARQNLRRRKYEVCGVKEKVVNKGKKMEKIGTHYLHVMIAPAQKDLAHPVNTLHSLASVGAPNDRASRSHSTSPSLPFVRRPRRLYIHEIDALVSLDRAECFALEKKKKKKKHAKTVT